MSSLSITSINYTSITSTNSKSSKDCAGSDFDALFNSISQNDDTDKAAKTDGPTGIANASVDQLLLYIQQMAFNTQNSLLDIGSDDKSKAVTDITGAKQANGIDPANNDQPDIYADPFLQGGPLPDFLARVDEKLGLNKDQSRSLREIAVAFKDAPAGIDTQNKIASALEQAGIPNIGV
jgi:hypothetical protein